MKNLKLIYRHLKEISANEIKKVNYFFRYKYPKLCILLLTIILAYSIFSNQHIAAYITSLNKYSYLGVFLSGLLFSFGFTTAFSIGLLITLQPQNIFFAAMLAGLGATISDLLIFRFIKISFRNEFKKLEKEKPIKKIKELINKNLGVKLSNYLLYVMVGFLIASPIPDEVGIALLAGLTHIKQKIFGVITFILHTTGIFIILLLSQ